jgi:hypothetical protein
MELIPTNVAFPTNPNNVKIKNYPLSSLLPDV